MRKPANILLILFPLIIASCGPLGGVDDYDDEPGFSNFCLSNPVSGVAESQTDAAIGESNGSVSILATGGTGEYTYSLNNGPFQESKTFEGLPAGEHTVLIKDDRGCTGLARFIIFEG